MIGFVKGKLLHIEQSTLLILVDSIGYEVSTTTTLAVKMANSLTSEDSKPEISLYVHAIIREDDHKLFGFIDIQERQLFRLLIKVNSIGAKAAMALLSEFSTADLVSTISNNDINALCRVPGIGKKSASRLVLEMQDSLRLKMTDMGLEASSGQEAKQALLALGFKDIELKGLLEQAKSNNPNASVETLIKYVLELRK